MVPLAVLLEQTVAAVAEWVGHLVQQLVAETAVKEALVAGQTAVAVVLAAAGVLEMLMLAAKAGLE